MKRLSYSRPLIAAFVLCLGVLVIGCKPNPEGKYTGANGMATLELKSGKATLGLGLAGAETFDYTVDGDKVTLTNKNMPGADVVLTIGSDGSLTGPQGVFKKSDK